jgi:hypothetical protein
MKTLKSFISEATKTHKPVNWLDHEDGATVKPYHTLKGADKKQADDSIIHTLDDLHADQLRTQLGYSRKRYRKTLVDLSNGKFDRGRHTTTISSINPGKGKSLISTICHYSGKVTHTKF